MFRMAFGVVATAVMIVGLEAGEPGLRQTPTPPPVAVDVNGEHIIIRGFDSARDWSGTTVELNDYWTFKVGRLPKLKDLCINTAAFTVKESVRGGRDFSGVHFEPTTMNVKTVSVRTDSGTSVSQSRT